MPDEPILDRSFVTLEPVSPGPGGTLPDVAESHAIPLPALENSDPVTFTIVTRWSGGDDFYRVGLTIRDASDERVAFEVGGELTLRHAVAYRFAPDKPPLRQFLEIDLQPRAYEDLFICHDLNGVEVYRYTLSIVPF